MRAAVRVLVFGSAFMPGCASSQQPVQTEEPSAVTDPALASVRRDNAELRRRIAMLEDRMLQVERRSEPEALALPDGKSVPIVKLEPASLRGRTSEDAGAASLDRSHTAASKAAHRDDDAAASKPVRVRARTLSTLPEPELEEQAWYEDNSLVPPSASEGQSRSFRLVGDRLVELTKSPPPRPPAKAGADAPARGKGGKKSKTSVAAAYKAAMARYQARDFATAHDAFAAIVRDHPENDYADNALYWQGEAAYDQQLYADALAAFTAVVERYGGGDKAPDALLKIGLCYRNLGDHANARDVLAQLIDAYPRARASDIARVRLAEMSAEMG